MIEFKPLGTARQGEQLRFIAFACRTENTQVILNIKSDDGALNINYSMSWVELSDDGRDVYECILDSSNMRGLYWYSADAQVYQLSVFSSEISPVNWYSKGVTYHIFVDRFNRGAEDKLSQDNDFYVHENLQDIPHYKANDINLDIYGGNLKGIEEKLSYLSSLGVKTLYLSPVFEAWSNHKYNTADFSKIDSHFGSESDLKSLCDTAKIYGIHIILDGVFNHVGSDSVYFNRAGRYKTPGAWQDRDGTYGKWFNFTGDEYDSWWGIDSLPAVNETESGYMSHIAYIAKHWIECGISGWRLDVADELPDEFLSFFNKEVKKAKQDAIIIGEVWEDASNKIAYSIRRKYFTECELDGVMNYPVREAILGFVSGCKTADETVKTMKKLAINYPKHVLSCLMNHIGTHDTVRALTFLGRQDIVSLPRDKQAEIKLTEQQLQIAKERLRKAAVLQYSYPGSPCIYYGDEAGIQGGADPFNRAYYPWGNEDRELVAFYKMLGWFKNNAECMQNGEFDAISQDECVITVRTQNKQIMIFCVSSSRKTLYFKSKSNLYNAITGEKYRSRLGYIIVKISDRGYIILTNDKKIIYGQSGSV